MTSLLEWSQRLQRRHLWWGLVCILLLALAWGRLSAAARSTGYAGHVDDRHLLGNAQEIIARGDWNPHFFKYPSLPIYLTTLSFYLGDAFDAGGGFVQPDQPFRVEFGEGWPYEPRALYLVPRLLFALLGVGTILSGALLAMFVLRRKWGDQDALFAALCSGILLGALPLLQQLNVTYLNVDTPAAFFTMLALTATFAFWERSSLLTKAVLPGILAGLATASKYNSGLILVPCILAIGFTQTANRPKQLIVLMGAFLAAFFVCVPYSILEHETFVKDVLFEMRHYRTGHPGHETEPGFSQASYYARALVQQLGWGWMALAAVGSFWLLGRDFRRGITLLSFPVLMLAHMSTNRVHFLRTVLPAFCVVCVLSGVGVAVLGNIVFTRLGRQKGERSWLRLVSFVVSAIMLVVLMPSARAASLFDLNIAADNRTKLVELLSKRHAGDELWITDDVCLSGDSWKGLGAKHLGIELKKLKHASVQATHGTIFVVPQYGTSRPPAHIRAFEDKRQAFIKKQKTRAKALNRLVESAFEDGRYDLVAVLHGNKIGLHGKKGHRPECVKDPALLVYQRRTIAK